jgi:fucose permease
MIGLIVTSTIAGRLISGHGHFKRYLVAGSVLLAIGFALLATMDHQTSMVFIGVALFIAGAGLGMTMQNLVLAVQNTVAIRDIGASTSTVTFFRSLGGTVGVGVLGAMVATQLTSHIASGLARLGLPVPAGGSSSTLDLAAMPAPVAEVVRRAFGDVTGHVFMVATVLSVIGLAAVLMIKEVPLRETLAHPQSDEEAIDTGIVVEL